MLPMYALDSTPSITLIWKEVFNFSKGFVHFSLQVRQFLMGGFSLEDTMWNIYNIKYNTIILSHTIQYVQRTQYSMYRRDNRDPPCKSLAFPSPNSQTQPPSNPQNLSSWIGRHILGCVYCVHPYMQQKRKRENVCQTFLTAAQKQNVIMKAKTDSKEVQISNIQMRFLMYSSTRIS